MMITIAPAAPSHALASAANQGRPDGAFPDPEGEYASTSSDGATALSNAPAVTPAVASGANPKSTVVPVADGGQSFDAHGTIDTITDITASLSFHLVGTWALQVRDGEVTKFGANMDSFPSDTALGKSHTHQLLNFSPKVVGRLDSDNNFFTTGNIEVGTNNKVSWTDVPVVITIRNGNSITVTLDDTKAGHHFAGQPLTGEVQSIAECSEAAGAGMSVFVLCQDVR